MHKSSFWVYWFSNTLMNMDMLARRVLAITNKATANNEAKLKG
ncbi:hypothetical protein B878_16890 [Vibrio campbellii CAIM 519 = NBRC 15631 = ATCC 25920]|nr:hypothetical protein B878_16890 [Vibrio campbellii CAIM 519 = NBRC 15631 = ATCC 25920]